MLVTGGAGYIGSHVVLQAQAAGHNVVVIDDLSTGQPKRLNSDVELIQLHLASPQAESKLTELLSKQSFDAVIHLAARKQVGESVEKPEEYFRDNIGALAALLLAMRSTGHHKLVFSSSAATYGMPDVEKVKETDLPTPINPYGQTKLIGEWMVQNATAWGLRGVSLRYFNVAGTGARGMADTAALNLIPIAIGQLRRGEVPKVFGNDYPTPDGSCIRDYIHVTDLAEAHLAAIAHLEGPAQHDIFNVGTGQGASVIEVLEEIRRVSGVDFEPEMAPRRAGDPPKLVADAGKIKDVLGFQTRYSLADIIDSAWNL